MLPNGITTSVVTFGTALSNVSRTDLAMRVTFTPTTNLVWAATGTVILGYAEQANAAATQQGSVTLIDPWQSGFVDGNGNQITNWGYRVKAEYLNATGTVVLTTDEKIITWSSSTSGPIDLDLLVPVPAASGIVVYLPDTWTGSISSLNLRVTSLERNGGGSSSGTSTSLNAKDYGAKGDGATDDTASLQTAINAAAAAKSPLHIPSGTYLLSATLTIPAIKGITISGAGWATILKLKAAANCYAVTLTGHDTSGLQFRDLKIDGNLSQQTGTSGGIWAKGSVANLFRNLHFTACRDDALLLTDQDGNIYGHNNRVESCLFDQSMDSPAAGFGIRMLSNDENQILNCDFQYLGGSGTTGGDRAAFILDKAGIQFITACNFVSGSTNKTIGVRVQDAANTRITGSNFDGTGGDSIFIAGSQCAIVGCTISGPGEGGDGSASGVHLEYNARNNLIVGNTIISNTTNARTRSFIREEAQGAAGQNLIMGNTFVLAGTITGPKLDISAPGTVARDNIGVSDIGTGTGSIINLQNVVTAPTAGANIYVQDGALKYRGGNGTVTTIGPA